MQLRLSRNTCPCSAPASASFKNNPIKLRGLTTQPLAIGVACLDSLKSEVGFIAGPYRAVPCACAGRRFHKHNCACRELHRRPRQGNDLLASFPRYRGLRVKCRRPRRAFLCDNTDELDIGS
jgi:hypothetical protein